MPFLFIRFSRLFNLSLSACSKVADRLTLKSLALCNKSLFKLKLVAFFGAWMSYRSCMLSLQMALDIKYMHCDKLNLNKSDISVYRCIYFVPDLLSIKLQS